MRRWLLSVFLLLQVLAIAYATEQKVLGKDGSSDKLPTDQVESQTNVGYESQGGWTPYQNGWELVDAAMVEFRKVKTPFYRKTKRQTGMFGSIFNLALKALPSLRTSAPPQEPAAAATTISGPLLEGVKLLQRSADQNNTDAIYLLGQLNFFGNFSHPRNFKAAFDHNKRLAEVNGNSSAQHMVGLMYATGLGDAVERDQAKALLYHTFAANQGHTRAEMTIAARHHSGIGVTKNCDMACKYYKRVADKAMAWIRSGPPGGMSIVQEGYRIADEDGGVYGEGASFVSSGINALKHSVSSDAYASIDDVIEYLDLMSQKGDFKASFNLGRIYYDGQRGLPRDVDVARRYFLAVATKFWRAKDGRTTENAKPGLDKYAGKAAGYIGRMWLRGEGGQYKQNFEHARKWFERGIKYGDAQSQWGLGLMLLKGYGVEKNLKRATDLLKAAATDFGPAQVVLGALHLDQGTPDDLRIAGSYFETAARYGNIEAQYYLAEMIHHGVGRDKTCNLAMQYYKVVAEKAEPFVSSWTEANQAYEDGDYELALLDYVLAAEQGYEKAQNNVAYMLDTMKSSFTVPSWLKRPTPRSNLLHNSALALIYWTRSAVQANIDSLVKMGDYYLNGVGTEAAADKAAQCYSGASEYLQSAQALYNLGWMHENGVGLVQDFHLAKRYYDQALETNDEAYLPVTLSLLKLRIRSAWNTFTHGKINSIRDDPDEHRYYEDGYDDMYDENMVGSDGEPFGEEFDELEGIIDSLIILALCGMVVTLLFYRQWLQRRRAQREAEENAARAAGMAPPPHPGPVPRGLGDPQFQPWGVGVGGVGH
ncbi:Protein sel-1-like protein 2 [Apiospora phragmitis]|uniref:Protein sel-1-like protein 2 n=1 Tax=Apiospora phragmitis TaxID=2905665 RepID=A0ABR1V0W5_9PEZI